MLRYLENVVTLDLDAQRCIGCGMCTAVCPHAVFAKADGKVRIADRNACMECGACAKNCPTTALAVTAGVGCAAKLIQERLMGRARESACCGPPPSVDAAGGGASAPE